MSEAAPETPVEAPAEAPVEAVAEAPAEAVVEAPPLTAFPPGIGVTTDPGEGLPPIPDAPPAVYEQPPAYDPTDIPDNITVFVTKALAYLGSDVQQHLTKSQYTEQFLPVFKAALEPAPAPVEAPVEEAPVEQPVEAAAV